MQRRAVAIFILRIQIRTGSDVLFECFDVSVCRSFVN
jgi:hypothetical protein